MFFNLKVFPKIIRTEVECGTCGGIISGTNAEPGLRAHTWPFLAKTVLIITT